MSSQNLTINSDCNKIYNYNEKKKIVYNIEKIKSKKNYFKLYNIVLQDKNVKFTKNNNGIFFNINKLNNKTLNEIEIFLNSINEKDSSFEDSDISNYEDSESIISIDEESNSLNFNDQEKKLKRKILIG